MTLFKKKLNPSPGDASTQQALNPTENNASYKPLSDGTPKNRPDPAAKWGYTPDPSKAPNKTEHDPAKCPPDHPVHKISPEKIEKLRKKGINPVLRAEMDEMTNKTEGKGFWVKLGMSSGEIR